MKIEIENIPEGKTITCIIPMRVSKDRLDAIDRLAYFNLDTSMPQDIGFLVVDDGSEPEDAQQVRARCAQLGLGYVRIESQLKEFSVGRCRNVGAMYARSTYILMQDVDLMPWPGFYQGLLDEIVIQGLDKDAKKFLMVPYVFLTEEGTQNFLRADARLRARQFLHAAWLNDARLIEKVSSGTSANLYNRLWYLSRGGNSPDFEGWGYEDLECNTRMLRHLNYFPTPEEWTLQKYNFNSVLEYRSWKAPYRLFGDMLLYKGVAFFHAWHPVTKGGTYMQRAEFNRMLFEKKMKEFVAHRVEPDALPDHSRGKTLLMRRNAFTFSRDMQPLLGTIIEPDAELLEGRCSLTAFVTAHRIDRVVFHNPYLDERMLALYREARENRIPFVICERGALPDSCFFDPSGFLVDGDTYGAHHWDRPIEDAERAAVSDYIKTLHNTDDALEDQPARVGPEATRKRLGLKAREKVLVVVFQRPGDTVTRHFTGKMGDYAQFVRFVEAASKALPPGWRLVAKRHPLEEIDFEVGANCVYANETHVKDLLSIADTLLTFNSGVGVLSMAWGVPTLLAGRAFYQDDRINRVVDSVEALVEALKAPRAPDAQAVQRFYHHLLSRVYSFGAFQTKKVKMPDGSNMTATMDIRFRTLRWPDAPSITFSANAKAAVSWDAFLFDRYRFSKQLSPKPAPAKPGTAIAPVPIQSPALTRTHDSLETAAETELNATRPVAPVGTMSSRLKKLRQSPARFFSESRHRPLKWIGSLFFRRAHVSA